MYTLKTIAIMLFVFFGMGMLSTAIETQCQCGCGLIGCECELTGHCEAPIPSGNSAPIPGGDGGLPPSPDNQNPLGGGADEQQTLKENQQQYCPGECAGRSIQWGGATQLWNGIPTRDGTCNCVCPSGFDFDNTGRRCVPWQEGTGQCQDKCAAAFPGSVWDGTTIFPNCRCVCPDGFVSNGNACVDAKAYANTECPAACLKWGAKWNGQCEVQGNGNLVCFCE